MLPPAPRGLLRKACAGRAHTGLRTVGVRRKGVRLAALLLAVPVLFMAAGAATPAGAAGATGAAGTAGADLGLPPDVVRALQRAQVPAQALAVVVQELGSSRTRLALRAHEALNPASLAKLFTLAAALEQLGPAWTWATPVWLAGPVREGVLEGALHIRGSGDPKLVLERVWLLLRRVQQLGVREIRGDIVLDRSAFAATEEQPADFDGEPLRPYNVSADALLLNYKSVVYTFVPDPVAGVAHVLVEPPLAGAQVDARVPLASGPCGDWRGKLQAQLADPTRVRFAGRYPTSCGENSWPVADAAPASYNARLLAGLWREMGGRLGGSVRDGPAPAGVAPSFVQRSPPLLEVVREIGKFSNNVMTQQLFLTLALQREPARAASEEAARRLLRDWLASRLGEPGAEFVLDKGSGLSRQTRVSAGLLARLLQHVLGGPLAAEFESALPILGVDGTLRRASPGAGSGSAHLKTGSLKDVSGLAGTVQSDTGRRYVLVALVNHEHAQAARPALQALVQWVMRDAPAW